MASAYPLGAGGLCVAMLKAGIVNSIAIPRDDGYVIYQFARGQACKDAAENYRKNSPGQKSGQVKGRASSVWDARSNARTRPEIGKFSSTSFLAGAGYFDECITTRLDRAYAYDIKIDYHVEIRESNPSCCNIAEIFEAIDGEHRLLGRWEHGRAKFAHVNPFKISDIIAELTGKPIDPLLAPNGRLKPNPIASMENELERLTNFVRNDAYIFSWGFVAGRVEKALQHGKSRKFRQSVGLERYSLRKGFNVSDSVIGLLIEISSVSPADSRENYFQRVSGPLDQDSKQRLEAARTRGEAVAR